MQNVRHIIHQPQKIKTEANTTTPWVLYQYASLSTHHYGYIVPQTSDQLVQTVNRRAMEWMIERMIRCMIETDDRNG